MSESQKGNKNCPSRYFHLLLEWVELCKKGLSFAQISKIYKVKRGTVSKYIAQYFAFIFAFILEYR